jgi:PAS domain S-box-containing protein
LLDGQDSVVVVNVSEPLIQASLLGEALDAGPALVFVADENMRYVAVNAKACDELGYTRAELLSLGVADVCRYDDAAREYDAMVADRALEGETTMTRKDGSTLRMRYMAGETRVAGMPLYISVGRVVA